MPSGKNIQKKRNLYYCRWTDIPNIDD